MRSRGLWYEAYECGASKKSEQTVTNQGQVGLVAVQSHVEVAGVIGGEVEGVVCGEGRDKVAFQLLQIVGGEIDATPLQSIERRLRPVGLRGELAVERESTEAVACVEVVVQPEREARCAWERREGQCSGSTNSAGEGGVCAREYNARNVVAEGDDVVAADSIKV